MQRLVAAVKREYGRVMKLWCKHIVTAWAILMAQPAYSETLQHAMTFDRVEARAIFGGLGGGSGPIGEVTEFYIDEIGYPLLIQPGDVAQQYASNRVFIIGKDNKSYVCPSATMTAQCSFCDDCAQHEKELTQYDDAHVATYRKQLRYVFPVSGHSASLEQIDPHTHRAKVRRVEFFRPVTNGVTPSIAASYDTPVDEENAAFGFRDKVYIYASGQDPQFYLCSQQKFTSNCLKCADCEAKQAEFVPFVVK